MEFLPLFGSGYAGSGFRDGKVGLLPCGLEVSQEKFKRLNFIGIRPEVFNLLREFGNHLGKPRPFGG